MPVGNTVAELVARLRADTGSFDRGMTRAQSKLGEFNKASSTTMQTMARMGERFNQVVSGMAVGAGVAVASLNRVGVQYNTLMQKTSAAFNVLLGSAEKSKEMIGELTEFAKTSPFPRQIFIEGAQQLIGFGMAARDVVPAFEAIQDAVAATGGSSAEIQQFTSIFANIKSMGRATTEDLMRFASAGIDSFKMLADQAGVSVMEMREMVTEGALGADDAIRMLTEGLADKFGGAASEVKKTWVGAKDRIAGAWRDIGSKLMAPFVDPNGGGAAVKWANQIADLLRYLESNVIVDVADAIQEMVSGWTKITDDIDLTEWIQKGIDLFEKYETTIKSLLPIVGGLAAGFAKQGLALLPVIGGLTDFLPLPGKIVGALLGLLLSTEESRAALADMGAVLQEGVGDMIPMIIPLVEDFVESLTDVVPPLIQIMQIAMESALPIMAIGIETTVVALTAFLDALRPVAQFLADHPVLVQAIISAYAGWKLVTLIQDVSRFATALRTLAGAQSAYAAAAGAGSAIKVAPGAGIGLVQTSREMNNATVAASRFRSTLSAAFSIGALAAVGTAFMVIGQQAAESRREAKLWADEATQNLDTTSLKSYENALGRVEAKLRVVRAGADIPGSDPGGMEGLARDVAGFADSIEHHLNKIVKPTSAFGIELPGLGDVTAGIGSFGLDSILGDSGSDAAQKQLEEQQKEIEQAIRSSSIALSAFANEAGVSKEAAIELAKVAGIDLSKGFAATKVSLSEAWKETKKNGDEMKILAAAAGMTVTAYERQQARFTDMENVVTPGLQRMMAEFKDFGEIAVAETNGTTKAFEDGAATIAALPEKYAETIAAVNQAVGSYLSPLQTWGEADKAALDTIKGEHDAFVSDLRNTYDNEQQGLRITHERLLDSLREQWSRLDSEGRPAFEAWAETTQGVSTSFEQWAGDSKATFDEWSQHINGVSFEEFSAEFDQAAMAFTNFMDMQEQKLRDLQTWKDNIRKIGERGGAELALELAKWGPEAATQIAQVANAGDDEFNRFKSIMTDTMSASTDALIQELALAAEVGKLGGAETVSGIENELGLMPGAVQRIAEEAKGDFADVMVAFALAASLQGDLTASNLTTALAEALGKARPEVKTLVDSYIWLFEELGFKVQSVGEYIQSHFDSWKEQGVAMGIINAERYGYTHLEENGGILKAFAKGGMERHVAQIAPAGAMRLWAEPETGGEAYIPLSVAKRDRSMAILGAVADLFGMSLLPKGGASMDIGGILGAVPSISEERSGGSNDIDYDKLAAAVASAVGTPLTVNAQGTSAHEVVEEARAILGWEHTGRGDR